MSSIDAVLDNQADGGHIGAFRGTWKMFFGPLTRDGPLHHRKNILRPIGETFSLSRLKNVLRPSCRLAQWELAQECSLTQQGPSQIA